MILLDIFLPKTCFSCKREGFFICPNCRETIEEYNYFICPVCKRRDVQGRLDQTCREATGLTRFFGAPLPYANETVRKTIHAFKYQHARDIAEALAQILIEFLEKNTFGECLPKNRQRVLLVPVPLSNFRERERGFNQATEIAKYVSAYYNIEIAERILTKLKNTEPQADMKNEEGRAANIAGVFSIKNRRAIERKVILLIDDVYTSGATMKECAKVLRQSGASEVWGITVARG